MGNYPIQDKLILRKNGFHPMEPPRLEWAERMQDEKLDSEIKRLSELVDRQDMKLLELKGGLSNTNGEKNERISKTRY